LIVAVGTGNAPVAVKIGWTRQWPNRKVMRPSLRATNAGEIKNEIKTRIDESAVIVIKIVVKIERRIATRTRIVSGNDHAAVVIARVNDVIGTSKSNPFLDIHLYNTALGNRLWYRLLIVLFCQFRERERRDFPPREEGGEQIRVKEEPPDGNNLPYTIFPILSIINRFFVVFFCVTQSMNSMLLKSMTNIITMTPIISSMKRVNPISRRKNTNTDNEEVANCV
jgi:hypothetical protein